MSHVTQLKTKYRDLDALEAAAEACGMKLVRGQKTHEWYGTFVGDSRPPDGVDPKDYGKCEHAIRLKDHRPGDYEIGVVTARDGDGFELRKDDWGPSGHRLHAAGGGVELTSLKREYAIAKATTQAQKSLGRKGWKLERENLPGNRTRLKLRKA